jgi:hypothetical protein
MRWLALAAGLYCVLFALASLINLALLLLLGLGGRWENMVVRTPLEVYVLTPALAALTAEVVLGGVIAWVSRRAP